MWLQNNATQTEGNWIFGWIVSFKGSVSQYCWIPLWHPCFATCLVLRHSGLHPSHPEEWSTVLASVIPVSADCAGWSELRFSGWAHRADQRIGDCLEKSGLDICSGFTPRNCWGKQVTAMYQVALLADNSFSFFFFRSFFPTWGYLPHLLFKCLPIIKKGFYTLW